MIKSHKPIKIPKYTGFDAKSVPTITYKRPIIKATTPFHLLSPAFVITPIIPTMIRNIPTIYTIKPATKLNNAGLNMNPIPKTRAIIPKSISSIPNPTLSPISTIPLNRSPRPNTNTRNPVKTAAGITPMRGNAITIIPRIIKTIALPNFCII